ncbi:hypothetical protein TRP66_17775 [Pseudomonas sp. JDS28PS106]|uniref:hypothetical protein n=1 Tax=Pseudomonas sp. JDS28PS106 TaxID=2497235 RepID=UPI002FD6972A
MNIACLGWGSLIWKPGTLPLAGEWYADGPHVPIEFSRVGDGGELATAICLNAPVVPVYWALMAVDTLEQACAALHEREQIPLERVDGVGRMLMARMPLTSEGLVVRWARERGVDAVVWTALPPRFMHQEGRIPTDQDALTYLAGLTGDKQEHARHYIEQVPRQIDTPYRRAIERHLGWKR